MDLTDDAWVLVKNTPGVTGFVGSQNKPVPLSQPEVDRMLHVAQAVAQAPQKSRAEFELGESVKVTSGPLADFDGEIAEINEDQGKLEGAASRSSSVRCRSSWSSTKSRRSRFTHDRGSASDEARMHH